jgi:hypothetical protein
MTPLDDLVCSQQASSHWLNGRAASTARTRLVCATTMLSIAISTHGCTSSPRAPDPHVDAGAEKTSSSDADARTEGPALTVDAAAAAQLQVDETLPIGCLAASSDGILLLNMLYRQVPTWVIVDSRNPDGPLIDADTDSENIVARTDPESKSCILVRWGWASLRLLAMPDRFEESNVVTLTAKGVGEYESPDGSCSLQVVDLKRDGEMSSEARLRCGRALQKGESFSSKELGRVDWIASAQAFAVTHYPSDLGYSGFMIHRLRTKRQPAAPPLAFPEIAWGKRGKVPEQFRCDTDPNAPDCGRPVVPGMCWGCELHSYEVDIDDDGDLDVAGGVFDFPLGNGDLIAGRQVNPPSATIQVYQRDESSWSPVGTIFFMSTIERIGVTTDLPAGRAKSLCAEVRDTGYETATGERYIICYRPSEGVPRRTHEGFPIWEPAYQFEARYCHEGTAWVRQ